MLMLDQIPRMCEEFAASTLEEERLRIAKMICDECVSVIRKRCDIDAGCFSITDSETAMKYYCVSTRARTFAKQIEKRDKDEYMASVIAFYASVLAQKSLILVDYYRKKEAKAKGINATTI